MDWISSDFHYGHLNMCSGVSTWKSGMCRDFPIVKKMNDAIVEAINSRVQQYDTLYFLGDWSFNGIENIRIFRERIICENIILILGNHDTHIENNKAFENNYDVFKPKSTHELFKSIFPYLELKMGKQKIILHHHPIEHWRDAEKGSIMLHGHMHGAINNCEVNTKFRRMDVGIDWKEFRPYTLDEVITKLLKRPVYECHEKDVLR